MSDNFAVTLVSPRGAVKSSDMHYKILKKKVNNRLKSTLGTGRRRNPFVDFEGKVLIAAFDGEIRKGKEADRFKIEIKNNEPVYPFFGHHSGGIVDGIVFEAVVNIRRHDVLYEREGRIFFLGGGTDGNIAVSDNANDGIDFSNG